MRNKPQSRDIKMFCALCSTPGGKQNRCEGGYVCEGCLAQRRVGRDATTQNVRTIQRALRGKADIERAEVRGEIVPEQQAFKAAVDEAYMQDSFVFFNSPARVAGGEILPLQPGELRDTLASPTAVALDASAHRLDLVSLLGNDVAAMALDAADTVGAANAMERMLAHQLAALHDAGMQMLSKARLESDPTISMRTLNVGMRAFSTYFQGCGAMQQLRGAISQPVHVGQVNVAPGGQAIVGNANTRRKKK